MTTFKLDDENENWMATVRQKKLKARGWIGTLAEWIKAYELLSADPLEMKPKVTSLADAKKRPRASR